MDAVVAGPAAIRDRTRGILLGLAAGDRHGGPIRMAVRLAESLCERRRFDAQDVMRRYVDWWREGAIDTGPVAARALALVAAGAPYPEAVTQVHRELRGMTAGCNPAHRSPPLAMALFLRDADLAALATREAALTHHSPLAGDVAAATVVLCRALLRGADWPTALLHADDGREPQTRAALRCPPAAPPSRGGFAPEALHAAVCFVDRSAGLADALAQALAFAAPANYCPVLVGAIGGARWGALAIPENELAHCTILARVHRAARALADEWDG